VALHACHTTPQALQRPETLSRSHLQATLGACEQAAQESAAPPAPPPLPLTASRGHPRQVDISRHFYPNADWAYQGRVGLGKLSAHGHPSGALAPVALHRLRELRARNPRQAIAWQARCP
jgi:hypothetical protein